MTAEERLHIHLAESVLRHRQPKIVCAYCQAVLREGIEPATHGCCRVCAPAVIQEAEHG